MKEERRRRIKIVCDECIEIEKNHGTALALEHARLECAKLGCIK